LARNGFLARNEFAKFEMAFWSEMALWPKMAFCQICLKSHTYKYFFSQDNFITIFLISNESAYLLKVLKGLARL
jgi:hypothetical protein